MMDILNLILLPIGSVVLSICAGFGFALGIAAAIKSIGGGVTFNGR